MSDPSSFVVADDGAVRHLILNRPDKLNALDLDQHVRIQQAVEEAVADDDVRVLALSGNGRAFCAGDDLRAGAPTGEDPLQGRRVDLDLGAGPTFLLQPAAALRRCPSPPWRCCMGTRWVPATTTAFPVISASPPGMRIPTRQPASS